MFLPTLSLSTFAYSILSYRGCIGIVITMAVGGRELTVHGPGINSNPGVCVCECVCVCVWQGLGVCGLDSFFLDNAVFLHVDGDGDLGALDG